MLLHGMRDGDEIVYVYTAWVLYVIIRWVQIDNNTFAFECSKELLRSVSSNFTLQLLCRLA